MESEDFITITQAARALGISDRQAHRYAGRLADDDRRKSDTGQTYVRLAAMRQLRPLPATHPMSDTGQTYVRQEADAGHHALIEQLRQENARLWQAFERQQVLTQDAQRMAQRAQDRVAELEAQAAKLIAALPVTDIGQTDVRQMSDIDPYQNSDSDASDTPTKAQNWPETGSSGQGGVITPPAGENRGKSDPAEKKHPWWRLWKK